MSSVFARRRLLPWQRRLAIFCSLSVLTGPGRSAPTLPRGGYEQKGLHPSPNVKTFGNFELQIWLEIITSRDAKSACFKGSRTSCREIIFAIFWPNFGQKRSHHVMDASCRTKISQNILKVFNSFQWAPSNRHSKFVEIVQISKSLLTIAFLLGQTLQLGPIFLADEGKMAWMSQSFFRDIQWGHRSLQLYLHVLFLSV